MIKAIDLQKNDLKCDGDKCVVINSQCTTYEIERIRKDTWFCTNRTAFVGGGKVYTDFNNMKRFIIAN